MNAGCGEVLSVTLRVCIQAWESLLRKGWEQSRGALRGAARRHLLLSLAARCLLPIFGLFPGKASWTSDELRKDWPSRLWAPTLHPSRLQWWGWLDREAWPSPRLYRQEDSSCGGGSCLAACKQSQAVAAQC